MHACSVFMQLEAVETSLRRCATGCESALPLPWVSHSTLRSNDMTTIQVTRRRCLRASQWLRLRLLVLLTPAKMPSVTDAMIGRTWKLLEYVINLGCQLQYPVQRRAMLMTSN